SGTQHLKKEGGAEVAMNGVCFAYPEGGTPALNDVSFVAKPGETVALVGATGSGKSTLAHMIPRFYEVTAGAVLIDGVDVRELDLRELRRSVGMIFQETILFSASVAENVAYGRPQATREQVIAAARAAHAHEFIMELENGYETMIGERGVSLSGGQKQRLAIARAFLLDPRILILDDATSSLDSKTERLIQEDMRRVCLGRTAFVIAHRMTTVQNADLVLVLSGGRVVERGTPAELIAHGRFFAELFRGQWDNGPVEIPATEVIS
ncbi:MAG: ATP-binding cassette domain-containing protein, partial [Verrucomicrobiota bacterium]